MKSPVVRTADGPDRADAATSPANGEAISEAFYKWSTLLLLVYFGARLLYLALSVSSFVPPDEVTHAGVCRVFAKALLMPRNTPESYEFGLVTNIPWLYYFLMGKLLHLNFFGIADLTFLRLLNIPIAFGTVFFARRTLSLLTENRLAHLLLLVLITNTAMFSLLSASVSYDNLTNCLAAAAVYYLLAFFKKRSPGLFAAAVITQLAGCLTKSTFLPLVLVLDTLLVLHEIRNIGALPACVAGYLKSGARAWIAAAIIIVGIGLNLQLYGGNYLHYGSVAPSMENVVSADASMQYRIGARERIFRLYQEGKIPYMTALEMAGDIRHPGDKSDTFFLLMNYENLKANPKMWLSPAAYVKAWLQDMTGSIMGIKGHVSMFKHPAYMIPVYLVLLLSAVGLVWYGRPRQSGWLPMFLAVIACFYAGFLLYKVNYNAYLYYGVTGITLQGRYLFPVLGPIYVLCSWFLLRLMRNRLAMLAAAAVTALVFISYDFPWFLTHATAQWFTPR